MLPPPDFCLRYKSMYAHYSNCWEVRVNPTQELLDWVQEGEEVVFLDSMRQIFNFALRNCQCWDQQVPCVLQLSNQDIEDRIICKINLLTLPDFAKRIQFRIKRGKDHPHRGSD